MSDLAIATIAGLSAFVISLLGKSEEKISEENIKPNTKSDLDLDLEIEKELEELKNNDREKYERVIREIRLAEIEREIEREKEREELKNKSDEELDLEIEKLKKELEE